MKVLRTIIMAGLMLGSAVINAEALGAVCPVKDEISNGAKVAILDSGSNIAYTEGVSLVDGSVEDYNGHGTLIAGIIKEVNPQAELYIIKVIGKDGLAVNEAAVILGLEWAISKEVDIINISLRLKHSQKLYQVIKKAYAKGIVIVAAAGNKHSKMNTLNTQYATTEGSPEYRRRIRNTQHEIVYPAKYDEVIAVGAHDSRGRVYEASIKGEDVDVFYRGYKGNKAGTSIASAYAAGFAAKLISENPNTGIEKIKELLQNTTVVNAR